VKITIENDEGQKVEFSSWEQFETKILTLSCEQCGCKDDVILNDQQNKVLREFLYGEARK
jgi:hypothetical protein